MKASNFPSFKSHSPTNVDHTLSNLPNNIQNKEVKMTPQFVNQYMKRVPFSQILNQEEQDSIKKIPHKLVNVSSPSLKKDISAHQVTGSQKMISATKRPQQNLLETKGIDSIQLISIVQEQIKQSQQTQMNEDLDQKIYNKKRSLSHDQQKRYKLVINQQAVQSLIKFWSNQSFENQSQEKEKAFICSVVGKSKTGKSFFLNQLINSFDQNSQPTEAIQLGPQPAQINSFTVNHTLAPCTKGIWMSQRKTYFKSNGKVINMLFLDTQGLASYQSNQQLDYKLLVLSLLLTDVLCFNSIGPIDERMLNEISLAVQISKLIKINQSKSNTLSNQTHLITTPSLLWVLRDFSLKLITKNQQQISEDQYLENCLSYQAKSDQKYTQNTQSQVKNGKILNKNEKRKSKESVRKAIREIFKNRKCSTLVIPFDQEGKMREEFNFGLQQCKLKLKGLIEESKGTGHKAETKIEDFICGLKAYVDALNNQGPKNGEVVFPKLNQLEENLTKTKVQFELKKISQNFKNLFIKYQQNLENLQSESECRETYLSKMDALKNTLQLQIEQINSYFNRRISLRFNLKPQSVQSDLSILSASNQLILSGKNDKKGHNINFITLLANGNRSKVIETIQKNYEEHLNSIRQRKSLILGKIESKIESLTNRSNFCGHKQNFSGQHSLSQDFFGSQNESGGKINNIQEQTNEWIQIMKSISKVSQLRKVYEKGRSEIKNYKINSQYMIGDKISRQQHEIIKCLKELQVEYLRQKINLMQTGQHNNSNTSFSNCNFKSCFTFKSICSQFKHQQQFGLQQGNSPNQKTQQQARFEECFNCQKSFYIPYIIIPSKKLLQLRFIKTIFKEIHQEFNQFTVDKSGTCLNHLGNKIKKIEEAMDRKFKAEFIIEVGLNDKKWLIRRKLKDFIELNKIIALMFARQSNAPQAQNYEIFEIKEKGRLRILEINSSEMVFSSEQCGGKVRNELERFLSQLNGVEQIRNSRIFQKFVKINKQYLNL